MEQNARNSVRTEYLRASLEAIREASRHGTGKLKECHDNAKEGLDRSMF